MTAGLHKETFTTIIIDVANQFGLHKAMLEVMQTMQDSRIGIFEFMGRQGDKILLRELGTMKSFPITPMCPSLHHCYRIALSHEQIALTGRQ